MTPATAAALLDLHIELRHLRAQVRDLDHRLHHTGAHFATHTTH